MDKQNGAPNVCYIVNQYPKISHTFVRREIIALERLGLKVFRTALRGWDDVPIDEVDRQEQKKTYFVLRESFVLNAVLSFVFFACTRPRPLIRTLIKAVNISMMKTTRPRIFHFFTFFEALVLAKKVRKMGIDHLHAHFGTNSAEVAMYSHLVSGIPFSFTVHGPEEFDCPQFNLLALKIECSAFVVAISKFGRSQILRWISLDQWAKVHIIRCGLSDRQLNRVQQTLTFDNTLLCVARLSEQKGIPVLLGACSLLRSRDTIFKLKIIGDGPLKRIVQSEIETNDLGSYVELLGWQNTTQIEKELAQCGALIVPSFAEGLPIVILESLAMGKPVIASRIAGIPEIVDHNVGWLVDPGDEQALADAMITCLNTPADILQKMGKQGMLRVRSQHSAATEAFKLAMRFSEGKGWSFGNDY